MVKGGSARACKGRRGRRNLTKMQHRLLGCIHDPHSIPGATHPPVAKAKRAIAARKDFFLDFFRREPRILLYARRRLVLSTLVFCRICVDVAPYRVAMMARWMSASASQVLGQGCLEPITIAHADTQQCERFTMDLRLALSFFLSTMSLSFSPSLSFFRLALSFTRTQLGPSPKLLPAANSGVWMLLPLPLRSRGGPGSPLRDSSPSRLSPQHSQQDVCLPRITRSPSREATLGGFDLWIPWHRHCDDQSSKYGRNPHVSAWLSAQTRRPALCLEWNYVIISIGF